jgi:hypothetical protein
VGQIGGKMKRLLHAVAAIVGSAHGRGPESIGDNGASRSWPAPGLGLAALIDRRALDLRHGNVRKEILDVVPNPLRSRERRSLRLSPGARDVEKALTFLAVALATSVCLATAGVARGSEGRSAVTMARASTSSDSFCADLQNEISAQRFRFSGWRCKPGPNIRGHQTLLAWVKLTRFGGEAHLELLWLAETRPVRDALVIDALVVPHYGYEPNNVRQAFRIASGLPLPESGSVAIAA